jgi:hypothetical protein
VVHEVLQARCRRVQPTMPADEVLHASLGASATTNAS